MLNKIIVSRSNYFLFTISPTVRSFCDNKGVINTYILYILSTVFVILKVKILFLYFCKTWAFASVLYIYIYRFFVNHFTYVVFVIIKVLQIRIYCIYYLRYLWYWKSKFYFFILAKLEHLKVYYIYIYRYVI